MPVKRLAAAALAIGLSISTLLPSHPAQAASEAYERGLDQYFRGEWSAAREAFEVASQNGEAEADFYIARLFATPGYEGFDLAKTALILIEASERGDVEAFRLLFDLYYAYDGDRTTGGDFPVVASITECGSGPELEASNIAEFLSGQLECFGNSDPGSVADIAGIIGSYEGEGGPQYENAMEACGENPTVVERAGKPGGKSGVRFRPGCSTYATRQLELMFQGGLMPGHQNPEIEQFKTTITALYAEDAYLGFTVSQTYLGSFLVQYGDEVQREDGAALLMVAALQGDLAAQYYLHKLAPDAVPKTEDEMHATAARYLRLVRSDERLPLSPAGRMQLFATAHCGENKHCKLAGIRFYDQCRPFHRQQDYREDFFRLGGFERCLRDAWKQSA